MILGALKRKKIGHYIKGNNSIFIQIAQWFLYFKFQVIHLYSFEHMLQTKNLKLNQETYGNLKTDCVVIVLGICTLSGYV